MTRPSEFIDAIDDERVVAAIRVAESQTSCEFRVFVSHEEIDYPVTAAAEQFERLHMHQTRLRNAVLIYIAPRSRNFALYADRGAHAHIGQTLLETLSADMGRHFRSGDFTGGLVHVLQTLGRSLAEAFPFSGDSGNELSDAIERG